MKTKQRKALAFLLCAALVLALCPAALAEGETPTETPVATPTAAPTESPVAEPTVTPETPAPEPVAKIGETGYPSLKEAISKAVAGDTVILLKDVTVNERIIIRNNITVDLSEKTITGDVTPAEFYAFYGFSNVVLKNGTINNGTIGWGEGHLTLGEGLSVGTANDGSVYALNTATVTVEKGATVSGHHPAIALFPTENSATEHPTLHVYGTVTSDSGFAICTNGNEFNKAATEINIYPGAVVTSEQSTAIYAPQPNGVVNVTGGTITGAYCGIELRAGTLNVSGNPEITTTAQTFSCDPNGNGTTTVGAAIAIAQHTTRKDIRVNISGGTFTGVKALNESNPQKNDPAPQVALSVTGGTFNGGISVDDAQYFISGGTFSEEVNNSYLLPGNTLVRNDDGMYTFGVADNAVAEVGGKGYTSLADAIEAAKNGGTVKLRNAASDVTIPAGTSVTIDLNGQTISSNADHAITNNGTLTIIGSGTVDGKDTSGKGALYNAPGATANLNGGTFTGSKWYVIKNLGTMTIDGASVVQNDIISSAIDSGYFGNLTNDCGVTYPSSATVTLNITSGSVTGGVNCVKNDDFGILNISGGSFSTTAPDGAVIMNWNKATISGGTFVGDGTAAVISNGYLSDTADKGDLTITNGTFTSTNNGKLFGTGSTTAGAKTTISGGTFTGQLNKISTTTVSISGGTYSVEVPDEFCAPGYHPEELENGRYGVSDTYHTGTTGSGLVSGGIVIGTGTNTGTVTDPSLLPPQTGDASVVGIAAALLLLASCGMAGLALRRSAKKREMN